MSSFPIINRDLNDVTAAKNGPNADSTVRKHELQFDGKTVSVDHTYFPLGGTNLFSKVVTVGIEGHPIDSILKEDAIGAGLASMSDAFVMEAISGLVLRQENGWVIVNDVHIPFKDYLDSEERPEGASHAGGRAEGVEVHFTGGVDSLEVVAHDPNVIGVFLKGSFSPQKSESGESPIVASFTDPTPTDEEMNTVLRGSTTLASMLIEGIWRNYTAYVEAFDAHILENHPELRSDLDVIAMVNAAFLRTQKFDPTTYPDYTAYLAERSKARLDSAIAKVMPYAELMAQIKNDAAGKPRFDDEWVSEALKDSVISFGDVVEALDAHGTTLLVGNNAPAIIEEVKSHYSEQMDFIEGITVEETDGGVFVISLVNDTRSKPTADQNRRRACLKTALGSINALFLANQSPEEGGSSYRLSLAESWDLRPKTMVFIDDKNDVWPVVLSKFPIEGYAYNPELSGVETMEMLGEVLNSMMMRQGTGMRIDSITLHEVEYKIPYSAWERVTNPDGQFLQITLGGMTTPVDFGDVVKDFDPTQYLKDLGELKIAGRMLKVGVLDPTEVDGLVESHPIVRLMFSGGVQAFVILLADGQPVRADDVISVGEWYAIELNSVMIARGDTEARLKHVDDNMSSFYIVSHHEAVNASYGPVFVSAT